ncbi:lipopolysaccharide biosynthesis protein [Dongia sp.]|uniref:lipopolysaccharide biosynthesis protein n=1 Tax=Dongia sp. TaxID=1977262 RepID=UPI0035B266BF
MTLIAATSPATGAIQGRRQEVASEDDGQGVYDRHLKKKTRNSIIWTVIRLTSNQFFAFAVFVVLARLLNPHDIGIFAIVTLFSEFARILANGGLTNYIVRARKLTPELLDTIFWGNMALAVFVSALVIALANPVLNAIGQPLAVGPMMVVGSLLPIVAAGASHMALRLREFGHKSMAVRSMLSGALGGGAAIAAAFAGWGIWSLVVQRVVTEIVNTLVSWQAYNWRPGRKFAFDSLREMWGFSSNIAITQIIFLFLTRVQDLVVGATIGAVAVGIYRTAWRMTELITNGAIQPFTQVAVQTFSRLQDNRADLIKAYRGMVFASSTISFPALVGFGIIARDAVPVVYGPQWHEAGYLAQIFALMVVPFSLNYFVSPVLSAIGRGSDMRWLATLQLFLTLGLTILAAPFGIAAVAWAYVGRAYLTFPLQLWLLKRRAGIGFGTTFGATAAPFAASLVMGAGVWLFMWFARPLMESELLFVAAAVGVGIPLYGGALLVLSGQSRQLLMRQVRKRLGIGRAE